MLGIRNHNRNIYLVNNDYNYTKYLLLYISFKNKEYFIIVLLFLFFSLFGTKLILNQII